MNTDTYTIQMGGKWTLEDISEVAHVYSQAYAFLYVLNTPLTDDRKERLHITFTAFPWRGGYSAVNFYLYLKALVLPSERPQIVSLRYGSEGLLELALLASIAVQIGILIKTLCLAAKDLNELYSSIYRGLQDRKLMRTEVKRKDIALETEQLDFIIDSSDKLSKMMGFQNVEEINKLTGSPLATLKILLSFYRRIRVLAGYEKKGKAKF